MLDSHQIHRIRFVIWMFPLIVLGIECVAQGSCLDLEVAIRSGVAASEAVQIQNAVVDGAKAQLDSIQAGVMPKLSLSGAIVKQDFRSSASSEANSSSAAFQTASKIVLTQPIYQGGREYALLRAANAQVESGNANVEATRIRAARTMTNLFFNALGAQAELAALTDLQNLSERRHSEIKSRVAIGRSRATDGLGAEAQVSSARAQVDAAKVQFDSTRRALSSATRTEVNTVCEVSPGHLPVARWEDVRLKVMARPDLIAEQIAVKIAAENVEAARAGHMPTLDASGNFYLKRADSRSSAGNWDVTLNASLPLYSGGGVNAAVREAKAIEMQQVLRRQLAEKDAIDEAYDLWERYSASRKQNQLLDESATKSDAYYRHVAKDERLGLATSLETLQALNSAIDSRRAAVKSRIQLGQTWRTLLLTIGSAI